VWGDEFRHPADLLAPVRPDGNMRRERRINVRDGNYILVASNSFLLCSACTTSSCVVIAVRILIYTAVQKFWTVKIFNVFKRNIFCSPSISLKRQPPPPKKKKKKEKKTVILGNIYSSLI